MHWSWQEKNWPHFIYYPADFAEKEYIFLQQGGYLQGIYQHLTKEQQSTLTIDFLGDEALNTSKLEGEYLNRQSLRSSICRLLGLQTEKYKIPLAEQGITEMLVDLHQHYHKNLTHKILFDWHLMLTVGRRDLEHVGAYRQHEEAMQVVSGPIHRYKIHYEAPPSKHMRKEMNDFIQWFNASKSTVSPLIRASIAHLYFVLIHPFEDGNGRIARAISEKALAQALGCPSFISLSHVMDQHKKKYYAALEATNKTLAIDAWLHYFIETILAAQAYSINMIHFLIEKTKWYDRFKDRLNERQQKMIVRIFKEGIKGFEGGLSAANYISITKTSRATATRDLQELVEHKILSQKGERKHTRYYLNV